MLKIGWEGRFLEDFEVGDLYRCRFGRTVTEADNIQFTLLTNNTNQINRLTYMLASDDLAQHESAWAAFRADEERRKAFAETERDGSLVASPTNTIMEPTAYSPLQ